MLDTNVLSEIQNKRPHPAVTAFLNEFALARVFVSVMSFGELRKGVAARAKSDVPGAQALAHWVDHIESAYADRILGVDREVVRLWGEFSAQRSRPVVDTLLAATAIHHGLTLVTRNLRDVADIPVTVRNPWVS